MDSLLVLCASVLVGSVDSLAGIRGLGLPRVLEDMLLDMHRKRCKTWGVWSHLQYLDKREVFCSWPCTQRKYFVRSRQWPYQDILELRSTSRAVFDHFNKCIMCGRPGEDELVKDRCMCPQEMTSLKDIFNKGAAVPYAPRITFPDLQLGVGYDMVNLKSVTTQFGPSIVASIIVPEREGVVHDLFLPKRFSVTMTEERVEEYNRDPNLKLVYHGLGPRKENMVSFQ